MLGGFLGWFSGVSADEAFMSLSRQAMIVMGALTGESTEGCIIAQVSFIELFGDSCFDMLHQGAGCQLTTAQDGFLA